MTRSCFRLEDLRKTIVILACARMTAVNSTPWASRGVYAKHPSTYVMTYRVPPEEFDGIVVYALEQLAPEFFERLQSENVDIVVESEPSLAQRADLGLDSGDTLFGLSEGVSLRDGGSHNASMPSKITIFQRPIEDAVDSMEELEEEVLRTVWHEVGHFLGFDEHEVTEMGLG